MKWTATLAVAAASVCFLAAQCTAACVDDGWVDVADDGAAPKCVYFRRTKASWYEMRTFCEGIAAKLVKLTGNMHQKVVEYINSQPAGDLDDEAFWTGGNDLSLEGSWKWEGDNSLIPMGPPHWYACNGQPSGGDKKNCMCLFTPDFYFHSCTCDYNYMGICEL